MSRLSQLHGAVDDLFSQAPKIVVGYRAYMAEAEKNAKVLSMQFERRKAAYVSAKAGSQRSGSLDVAQLANYKLVDDIFARNRTYPKGKNHSFHVVLDWSGSMDTMALSAMQQTFIQAMFLRRQKIDHKIMMFLSHGRAPVAHGRDLIDGAVSDSDGSYLATFFTNKMSQVEFTLATKLMYMLAVACCTMRTGLDEEAGQEMVALIGIGQYGYNGSHTHGSDNSTKIVKEWMGRHGMGGTPLNSTLLEVHNLMRVEHMMQPDVSQNLVVITDGASATIHVNNKGNTVARSTWFTRVDGRTHLTPRSVIDAVDRNKIRSSVGETLGVFSLFDWGVNRTMIFLVDQSNRESETDRICGDGFIGKSKASRGMGGKILNVSNVFGCIDDLFMVGISHGNRYGNSNSKDAINKAFKNSGKGLTVEAYAAAAKAEANSNPIESLSAVVAEAIARNYRLTKGHTGDRVDPKMVRVVHTKAG